MSRIEYASAILAPFDIAEELGSEIVNIKVGTGRTSSTFIVHKRLLCTQCPAFDRMFHGSFQEGVTQSARLREDVIRSFELFLGWLYRDKISHTPFDMDLLACSHELIRLFGFAEKYCIVRLMDNTMDLIHSLANELVLSEPDEVLMAYYLTHDTSKLRKYACRRFAQTLLENDNDDPAFQLFLSNAKLEEVMRKNQALALDVVKLLRGTRGAKEFEESNVPRCRYHQHGEGKGCPYIIHNKNQLVEG